MITFDFETKSYADLRKVGAWAYSEDPTTDVICACWQIDDGPIQSWAPGDVAPSELFDALAGGAIIEAHNVAFERAVWMNVMSVRYNWPLPPDDQWRDSMAVAHYYALPGGLDRLAKAIGIGGKDPAGGRLITKYSKLHLKTAKTEIPEDDLARFIEYCKQDVRAERAVSDYLGDLPARELEVFQLDQKINLRGLHLDTEGIECASKIVEQQSERLTKEFRGITGVNPTQRDKFITWLGGQGIVLENMQAAYILELLEGENIPSGPARRALEIRLAINKASTKKLSAMSRQLGKDGRAKFQLTYHGACTGRWTGSGFQPLNLNRGFEGMDPEQLVRDIMYGDADWLDAIYGGAVDAIAKAARYWITAGPGNKIVSGDFVSIEAVILACVAGEEWKIKAFANGVKIYEYMADKIHGLPPGTVTKATHPAERKDGKTGELAFGYQGALGAWLKFDDSGRHSDGKIIEINRAWRAEHPATTALWKGLQHASIKAVRTGELVEYNCIGFEVVDDWLSMILPGGKRIWYWKPEVRMRRPAWCKPEVEEECADGTCGHDPVLALSYMAQKEGQWKRVFTYGGKLTENACQAISREILVPAMLRAEEAGYNIIMNVYDEIVAEVPEDFGSLSEFESIMQGPLPAWAKNWPVSVDAWEGKRYRK